MTHLKNNRLINALTHRSVDKTPVWIMRQAGRYLPEYQKIRQGVSDFMTLCQNPDLACEVTLQPLHRFDLDAAIVFSDILTIPHAMGMELDFVTGKGPVFANPLKNKADIHRLGSPDPEQDLRYVTDTIRLVQHELKGKVPLIGFAGSPWTLATYMVEGGTTKTFSRIKAMIYQQPQLLQHLLALLTHAVIDYLNAQIKAGVNAVMIFDSWGGVLSYNDYPRFSLNYMQQIIAGLIDTEAGKSIPSILFTKNGDQWLEGMATTGCNGIGIDWTCDLTAARARVGNKVALQGNLDPCVLYGSPATIRAEVQRVLKAFGHGNGHVFNLGHGIYPDIPFENVQILVDAVHEFSVPYHQQATMTAQE